MSESDKRPEEIEGNGADESPREQGEDQDELKDSDGEDRPEADSEDESESQEGPAEDDEAEAPGEMTLLEHLQELRVRLVRCMVAAVVGFAACYGFSKQIFGLLMEPMTKVLDTSTFIYTYPPEAFFTYLKVSLVAGIFLTSPYLFYQFWQFVAPGLYDEERKWLVPISFCSAIFFVTGALFGYFVVFPFGFEFFASFANEEIVFTPKLSEYLGFALKLLFAFGFVFELPLFIFFLAKLGLVNHKGLRKFQKYAILLSFVASAILTPPDIFTQTLMAGPLILLYEVGIWVAYLFGKKPKPEPTEDDNGEAAQE